MRDCWSSVRDELAYSDLRKRTERRDLLPSEYLFGKRGNEWEFRLVVECWQTIGADHAVDLFLGPVLCGRVHQHCEEESEDDRHGLQA